MSYDMKKMAEQLDALTQRVAELERDKVPMQMKIVDQRLGRDFPLPEFATPGSAAIDLRAMMDENVILAPGEFKLIPSGIAVNMPNSKYCATILPRSGLGAKHGLVLRNLVGLIDSDYQGQIMMSIVNNGSEPFEIHVGDRIAQLKFALVVHPEFNIVTEFSESTGRGDGGFGHSGRQ